MSGELRITDAAAEQIATAHDDAALAVERTAGSLPPLGADGGPAASLLTQIIGKVVGDCADLATVNRGAAAIMRQVRADYLTSDDEVSTALLEIGTRLDGSGS